LSESPRPTNKTAPTGFPPRMVTTGLLRRTEGESRRPPALSHHRLNKPGRAVERTRMIYSWVGWRIGLSFERVWVECLGVKQCHDVISHQHSNFFFKLLSFYNYLIL
jgi:hypothetical protein